MGISQHLWSRRKFITSVTGAGAIVMLNPSLSWLLENADPRVAAIVAKTIGIDTHNHIDVPLLTAELPGPEIDLKGEMIKSGLSAICMTFAVDYQKLDTPGIAFERFLNGLTAMDKVLETNNIKRALNFSDIKDAHNKHKPIVIQSVEGGHFLEGKSERLEIAYKRGLRHLTLLHDNDASPALGDVFTNQPKWGGLTSFGSEIIKECNRLGILVDLSHATNETVNAALKVATKPVLVSHTGLDTQLGQNEKMAKMMRQRLISKEQAKIVANAGGVIGVWTHLADTPLEYAQNIKAMVNVAGIDHVCIGTDTKLTPRYMSPADSRNKPAADNSKGEQDDKKPNNKGQETNKNQGKMGGGTNEAWAGQKTGFYYTVVENLLKVGFNEDEIGKIGGGNFCRIFDAATKGY